MRVLVGCEESGTPAFSREWCMPNADTFSMEPVRELLGRTLSGRACIVDPFARGSKLAHHANDLNPEFCADPMEAQDFLRSLKTRGVKADALLLDPPYSPRQMSEAYKGVGLDKGMGASQNARLFAECKDLMTAIAAPRCVAVTFGWNSSGFGKGRGWALEEVKILCHGGAHNDTIIVVEWFSGLPQKALDL